jgi:hypothetical protein
VVFLAGAYRKNNYRWSNPSCRKSGRDHRFRIIFQEPRNPFGLSAGVRSVRQRGAQWLVLHHVPPKSGSKVSVQERESAETLTTYETDYFLSGHVHQFPYMGGNGAIKRIGGTILVVPGQLLSASLPNTITLDLQRERLFGTPKAKSGYRKNSMIGSCSSFRTNPVPKKRWARHPFSANAELCAPGRLKIIGGDPLPPLRSAGGERCPWHFRLSVFLSGSFPFDLPCGLLRPFELYKARNLW